VSRISVTPAELETAAGLLGSTRGAMRASTSVGGSLGTGALESALSALTHSLDAAAAALDEAIAAAAGNASAAAGAYITTDERSMPR